MDVAQRGRERTTGMTAVLPNFNTFQQATVQPRLNTTTNAGLRRHNERGGWTYQARQGRVIAATVWWRMPAEAT